MQFLSDINGIRLGGTELTIGNDQVETIPLPSSAGFVAVVRSDPPNANFSGLFCYDEDNLVTMAVGASSVVDNRDDLTLTGTAGTDGDMVLAVNSNALAIENRTGATRTFKVMFL